MTPNRVMFWQIDHVWLFYVSAALSVLFFFMGVGLHVLVWRKSAGSRTVSFSGDALKKMLLDAFLGRRLLEGDVAAGLMHLLIFWGISDPLHRHRRAVDPPLCGCFSEGRPPSDILPGHGNGGPSCCWQGSFGRSFAGIYSVCPRLERRLEDAIVPLWLLLMVLSGFILEGARLSALQPSWGGWSFVGLIFSGLFSSASAEAVYPALWWIHTLFCLSFIALIPYTKLFHILGAPAGIYFQNAAEPVLLGLEEGAGEFDLGDAVFFDGCMRCGRCVAACPSAGAGEPFAPREFVQSMRRFPVAEAFARGRYPLHEPQ